MNITSNGIKFLHSFCFYDFCRKSGFGGAIFFNCNGQIVQHRFCTTNTYVTDNTGFHSYANLLKQDKLHNIVAESSIYKCNQDNYERPLDFNYGNIGIYSSNFSKNTAKQFSVAYFENANEISIINYSIFERNYAANGYSCLYHNVGTYKDISCIFIGNNQTSTQFGCILMCRVLTVENCTILGPYGNGKVFAADYPDSHYIYIINCNIDEYTTTQGTYSTTGIKFIEKQNFEFLEIDYCRNPNRNPKTFIIWQHNLVSRINSCIILFIFIE